jgi:hypothetical protein
VDPEPDAKVFENALHTSGDESEPDNKRRGSLRYRVFSHVGVLECHLWWSYQTNL